MPDLKEEMDGWIKDLVSRLSDVEEIIPYVDQTQELSDHNYDMIVDMQKEIVRLKEEVATLRMVQLLHLKNEIRGKA